MDPLPSEVARLTLCPDSHRWPGRSTALVEHPGDPGDGMPFQP